MQTKHYTINYLEKTGSFLKNLKEISYLPFKDLQEGIVLDLGCGTGADVINLAQITQNRVKVIGIDHDPILIDKALSNSASDSNDVEFILSEVYSIPFENNSIVGIRAERLLQHLIEPEKLIKEIYRVLKKDYYAIIIETDWTSLAFYTEHVSIERKINNYLTEKKVKNGFASRKLTKYFEDHKFKNLTVEICPFILHTLKEANEYILLEIILKEVYDNGYISDKEYEIILNRLLQMDSDHHFTCFMNIIIVSAKKF